MTTCNAFHRRGPVSTALPLITIKHWLQGSNYNYYNTSSSSNIGNSNNNKSQNNSGSNNDNSRFNGNNKNKSSSNINNCCYKSTNNSCYNSNNNNDSDNNSRYNLNISGLIFCDTYAPSKSCCKESIFAEAADAEWVCPTQTRNSSRHRSTTERRTTHDDVTFLRKRIEIALLNSLRSHGLVVRAVTAGARGLF